MTDNTGDATDDEAAAAGSAMGPGAVDACAIKTVGAWATDPVCGKAAARSVRSIAKPPTTDQTHHTPVSSATAAITSKGPRRAARRRGKAATACTLAVPWVSA